MNKDAVATLKLGSARGIALLVPAQAGLEVGEYAPNAVKKAVVGVGKAAKEQVDHMVRMQLPGVDNRRAGRGGCAGHCHLPRLPQPDRTARGKGGRMIGKLTGVVDMRGTDHVLLDVRGVGYIVYVSDRTLMGLPGRGETCALYTDMVVREDLMQLYGFPTLLEKEWHRGSDLGSGGGGEKRPWPFWARLGQRACRARLPLGDSAALRKAPGVGPKLALRIANELKDKAPALMAVDSPGPCHLPQRPAR